MKFAATFAVLAVFVAKAVVSAAPVVPPYDSALEARSDFVEGALEEVWARFYDELVEEREYDEDAFEFREYDEELFERAPMKKFGKDVVNNLAQNAHGYAKQYSESKKTEARNSGTRPFMANPAHRGGSSGGSSSGSSSHHASGKKRSLDIDEELLERSPIRRNSSRMSPTTSHRMHMGMPSSTPTPTMPTLGTTGPIALLQPTQPALQKYSGSSSGGSSSGKKRSLADAEEELFERTPMKKFGKDVASNLAQNAHGYAKQHTNANNANARNNAASRPFAANPAHRADALKKYTSSGDIDDEKFSGVVSEGVVSERDFIDPQIKLLSTAIENKKDG
ncbi:hypothetical protein BKA70DRAFT_1494541 [Coprinopsis sp. MPI-PUGE-AT-0042]|nr:hypothetical protein BKA70DRAFT_1494541 [Coprinopsis sp. MPI-PUGE-AT-0042]